MNWHGGAAKHLAVAAPQESARQLNARCGADACLGCQAHLEPLRDAIALHQEDLLLQRPKRIALDPLKNCFAQELRAVAMQDQKAGPDFRDHIFLNFWLEADESHIERARKCR